MADVLRLCTYNAKGMNFAKWQYLEGLMSMNDIIFIQEHWLRNCQSHLFSDNLHNVNYASVSPMSDEEMLSGRPYGGTAIVWNASLSSKVVPVTGTNPRLCAITITFECVTYLLCSIYMPCDTSFDFENLSVFNEVLTEVTTISETVQADHIICGGDFNTEMRRQGSMHTQALGEFAREEGFALLDGTHGGYSFNVDFSFENAATGSRSLIDHFVISLNCLSSVRAVFCDHSVDNLSDHSPIMMRFNTCVEFVQNERRSPQRPLWHKATEADLTAYRAELDRQLSLIAEPSEALRCRDPCCTDPAHSQQVKSYHDELVEACLLSSQQSIPLNRERQDSGRRRASGVQNSHDARGEQWHPLPPSRQAAKRRSPSRGVRGHAPPGKF